DAPCPIELESLKVQKWDEEKLKSIFVEFEFNSIGKRLFGDDFKAGRGYQTPALPAFNETETAKEESAPVIPPASLKDITKVEHTYHAVTDAKARAELLNRLREASLFAFAVQANDPDPKQARLLGIAFALEPHTAYYAPFSPEFRDVLESDRS